MAGRSEFSKRSRKSVGASALPKVLAVDSTSERSGKLPDLALARRRARLRNLARGIPPQVLAFLDELAEAALDHVLRTQAKESAMKRKDVEGEERGE